MTPPLVSVLIPTFNRRDVLGFAIESALAQTLTDFELLVCGDGCTDGTADLVRSYRDPRIVWHDWPKAPGFGYANRNRTLRLARGTLVAYLCHDDLWLPDHLQRLTALLAASGADWAYSQAFYVSQAGRIALEPFDLRDPQTMRIWRERHINGVTSNNVVHRRSCLDDYGYFNEGVTRAGDLELWLRIVGGGQWRRFAVEPTPTALHFVADWRRGRTWRRRVLERVDEWERPGVEELRLTVPAGVTEQEAVYRAMTQAPAEWMAAVRRGAALELETGLYTRPLTTVLNALQSYRIRLITKPYRWPP